MTATVIPFPNSAAAPEPPSSEKLQALAGSIAKEMGDLPKKRATRAVAIPAGQLDELVERVAQRVYTLLKPPPIIPLTDERLWELAQEMAQHMGMPTKPKGC